MDQPDHGRKLVTEARCEANPIELMERVFECFQHSERLVEIQHQSEWDRVVLVHGSTHPSGRGTGGCFPESFEEFDERVSATFLGGPPEVVWRAIGVPEKELCFDSQQCSHEGITGVHIELHADATAAVFMLLRLDVGEHPNQVGNSFASDGQLGGVHGAERTNGH